MFVCSAPSGRFEPTTVGVEWHRIASVNVPKLEREGDLQTLKQFLPEIAVGKVCAARVLEKMNRQKLQEMAAVAQKIPQ